MVLDNPPSAALTASQLRRHQVQLAASLATLPESNDAERPRAYRPRTAAASLHPAFPVVPTPLLDTPAAFERFDADTLFFIFYHQPGGYQQYLASRQLKRLGWRFHKKFGTWLQRSEEPRVKSDASERGAVAYFDWEGLWAAAQRKDFVTEYAQLEEE
jgi:CCR4-NOT transcription complex subunit 3